MKMNTIRDLYRLWCRLAGLFSLFAIFAWTTGDPAYLGFLGFAAFPFMGDHHMRGKAST